jgi:hypothetical protein
MLRRKTGDRPTHTIRYLCGPYENSGVQEHHENRPCVELDNPEGQIALGIIDEASEVEHAFANRPRTRWGNLGELLLEFRELCPDHGPPLHKALENANSRASEEEGPRQPLEEPIELGLVQFDPGSFSEEQTSFSPDIDRRKGEKRSFEQLLIARDRPVHPALKVPDDIWVTLGVRQRHQNVAYKSVIVAEGVIAALACWHCDEVGWEWSGKETFRRNVVGRGCVVRTVGATSLSHHASCSFHWERYQVRRRSQ